MSVHKRKGGYIAAVYIGVDPQTKKKKYKWGRYHEKRGDAMKEEAEMKLEIKNNPQSYIFNVATFSDLAEQFWEIAAPAKYTPSSYDMNLGYYQKHIQPIFNNVELKDLEPIHIQKFMRLKKDYTPETQRKIFYLLKIILDCGVQWEIIKSNPCIGIHLPPIKRKKDKEIWSPGQIAEFLSDSEVTKTKYYVMLLLSFNLGMRPGEVCGLQWSAVEKDYLTVEAGLDKKKRATDLKTSSSNRRIYLDAFLHKAFVKQKNWQNRNKLMFAAIYQHSDFVFTHEDGSLIAPQVYARAFKDIVSRRFPDFPPISIYGARHSYASNAIEAGVEPSVLAEILGHSSIVTTYNNYVHVKPEPIKAAVETMTSLYNYYT